MKKRTRYVVKITKLTIVMSLLVSVLFAVVVCGITVNTVAILSSKKTVDTSVNTDVLQKEQDLSRLVKPMVISDEEVVEIEKPVVKEEKITPVILQDIGSFNLTAYCPCTICCEQWGGSPKGKTTAVGVGAYDDITVAVDPKKIPYGTKLYIESLGVCIATDCGGSIKGNRIDVYFENHKTALQFGLGGGAKEVYIIK